MFMALVSCSQNEIPKDGEVIVDFKNLEKIEKTFTFSDFYTDFSVIRLENVKANMFNVLNMKKGKDNFIFKSRVKGLDVLLMFDDNGHFVRQIGELGHAKNEYLNILDYAIDNEKEEVLLLEPMGNVKVYGFDGAFHYEKKPEGAFISKIVSYPEGYFLVSEHYHYGIEDEYLVYCYDNDFNLKKKLFPVHETSRDITRMHGAYNVWYDYEHKKLMYYDELMQCTYSISGESEDFAVSTYKFDTKNNASYDDYINNEYLEKERTAYVTFGNNGMIGTYYDCDRNNHDFVYSYNSKELTVFDCHGFWPSSPYYYDGYYYWDIEITRLKIYYNTVMFANCDIVKEVFGDLDTYSDEDIIILKMKLNPDFPKKHAVDVEAFEEKQKTDERYYLEIQKMLSR